jgi:hypothetical protein
MDSFDRQLEERPHSSLQLVEGVAEPAFGAEAFVKKPGLALTVSCKTRSSAHSTRHSKGPRSASRHRRLRSRRALRIVTADIAEPTPAASVLQASGFRSDVTVFRLNARPRPKTGSESAFRRNTAERVYLNEAAHNPEVAGSNPAPATAGGPGNGAFSFRTPNTALARQAFLRTFGIPRRRSPDPGSRGLRCGCYRRRERSCLPSRVVEQSLLAVGNASAGVLHELSILESESRRVGRSAHS